MTCERCGYATCRCVHVYDLDRKLLRVEPPYDAEKRRRIMFPKQQFNSMQKKPDGDWLTSREYAELIGRDISTVTNKAHRYGGVRVGGRWWFPPPKDVVEHVCPKGFHKEPSRACRSHGCKCGGCLDADVLYKRARKARQEAA